MELKDKAEQFGIISIDNVWAQLSLRPEAKYFIPVSVKVDSYSFEPSHTA